MKILRIGTIRDGLRKALVLGTIVSFMMLLVGDFSYPDAGDEARQRLEEGSSIMKPGYLALDDWKDGGVNDRVVGRRNDVEKDIADQVAPRTEVEPVLKKKVSTKQEIVGYKAGDEEGATGESTLGADEYIPPSILEYLNTRNAYVFQYDVVLSGEKYKLIWAEGNADWGEVNVWLQTFDKNGERIGSSSCLTEGRDSPSAYFNEITELANGEYMFVIGGSDANGAFSAIQIMDENGKIVKTHELSTEDNVNQIYIQTILQTRTNGFLFIWEQKNAENENSLWMQTLKNDYREMGQAHCLTEDVDLYYGGAYRVLDCDDESQLLIWVEYRNDRNNAIGVQRLDENGEADGQKYYISGGTDAQDADIQYETALSNEEHIIFWSETDSKKQASLWAQKIDKNGEKKGESYCLTDERSAKNINMVTKGLGLFIKEESMFIWRENYTNGKGALWAQKFDENINPVGISIRLTDMTYFGAGNIKQIIDNPDGSHTLVWYQYAGGKHSLWCQTLDSEWGRTGKSYCLTADRGSKQTFFQNCIMPLSNDSYLLAWDEIDSSGNHSVWVQHFDESGHRTGVSFRLNDRNDLRLVNIVSFGVLNYSANNQILMWQEYATDGSSSFWAQKIDENGSRTGDKYSLIEGQSIAIWDVRKSEDGRKMFVFVEHDPDNGPSLWVRKLDKNGETFEDNINLKEANGLKTLQHHELIEGENGSFTLVFYTVDASDKCVLWKQTIDKNGNKLTESQQPLNTDDSFEGNHPFVLTFPNGTKYFIWKEIDDNGKHALRVCTFNQNWELQGDIKTLTGNKKLNYVELKDVENLPSGGIRIEWSGTEPGSDKPILGEMPLDEDGKQIEPPLPPPISPPPTLPTPKDQHYAKAGPRPFIHPKRNTAKQKPLKRSLTNALHPNLEPNNLLAENEDLKVDLALNKLKTDLGQDALRKGKLEDMLENALLGRGAMDIFNELKLSDKIIDSILVRILNEPTEDEEEILKTAEELKKDLEDENLAEPGLNQASDDFIRVVANVLLAQALPDLFTEQGMMDIKTLFDEFNKEKNEIFQLYRESVKPYYENIKDELIKNRAILEVKDILSPDMNDNDITNLGRKAVDSIITKLKAEDTHTAKEKALLKKEAELRGQYLNPALVRLEENMRFLLQSYTRNFYLVLEGAGLVKKEELS